MDRNSSPLVLIIGAGINGASCARELVLNGISVVVVDDADVAFGASSKSTRLIHGGLRYLEYGEFDLVRESLEERTRLLRLAPHYVRPLRLCIPVNNRLSGVLPSMLRFLKLEHWAESLVKRQSHKAAHHKTRGLWLVRMGLRMYQIYARDPSLPPYAVHRTGHDDLPEVDAEKYPWLAAYSDGQIINTERWVIALLHDTAAAGKKTGAQFHVYTHHRVVPRDGGFDIVPVDIPSAAPTTITPSLIINATGAAGDATLGQLNVDAPPLFAGTKGSHILTHNPRLRAALHDKGVYAEAGDARLVFVLPFDGAVLVGTTDEPFTAPPENAVASDEEITYLIDAVNELFPHVGLTRDDVALHYSGVRPLPRSSAKSPGAVTRRHWIEEERAGDVPVLTLIGGKLTTSRSLGEQTTDRVLELLHGERTADTKERFVPGGENYPANAAALQAEFDRLAGDFNLHSDQIAAVWRFFGTQTAEVLEQCEQLPGENVDGTHIPLPVVRWIIQQEWVQTLGDLVERRILLIFEPAVTRRALEQLAALLVEAEKLPDHSAAAAVDALIERLSQHYGISVSV